MVVLPNLFSIVTGKALLPGAAALEPAALGAAAGEPASAPHAATVPESSRREANAVASRIPLRERSIRGSFGFSSDGGCVVSGDRRSVELCRGRVRGGEVVEVSG